MLIRALKQHNNNRGSLDSKCIYCVERMSEMIFVILKSAKLLHSLILPSTEFQKLDTVTERADLLNSEDQILSHSQSPSRPPIT